MEAVLQILRELDWSPLDFFENGKSLLPFFPFFWGFTVGKGNEGQWENQSFSG